MKRVLWVSLLALVVLGLSTLPVGAADVWGPYNNSQSALSFDLRHNEADISLYALNAGDKPFLRDDGRCYELYAEALISPQPLNPPYPTWGLHRFQEGNGDTCWWPQFPSMICEEQANEGEYNLTAAAHCGWPILYAGRWGNTWDRRTIINPVPFTYLSRLVAQRGNPQRQWVGCDWTSPWATIALVKSEDGWINPCEYLPLNGLPEKSMIYSLAFDDGEGRRGVAVVARGSEYAGSYLTTDPHANNVPTYLVYMTVDGGQNWTQIPHDTFLSQPLLGICNLQVAMIPAHAGDLNGDYFVYLMGIAFPTTNPSMYFRFSRLEGDQFSHWTPQYDPFYAGTVSLPNYPFDMIVERNANEDSIQILVATQNQLFYGIEPDIYEPCRWQERMGSNDDRIRTLNFRDIAVDPNNRAKQWAVAGEACSYVTNDAGVNWTAIHQMERLFTYPQSPVRQCGDSMAVVYGRTPFTSSSIIAQTHYAPVCLQMSIHQEGGQEIAFGRTANIGWTYDSLLDWIDYDIARTEGSFYYATWADPFLSVDEGQQVTKGVVYVSLDRGENWTASLFLDHIWANDETRVPVPSQILVDPLDNKVVYLSFYNVTGLSEVTEIPPYCYSLDRGETWRTPANNGLDIGNSERLLATGYWHGLNHEYMGVGARLYFTEDLGENWQDVPLPEEFDGLPLLSVSCSRDEVERVTVATDRYFAISTDFGSTWTVFPRFQRPLIFERVICDPFDISSLNFWAVTYPDRGTPVRTLWASNDGARTWSVVESWGDDAEGYAPLVTDLYVEPTEQEDTRRIIWTNMKDAVGKESARVHPVPVKYYELTTRETVPPLTTGLKTPVPLTYSLAQNYPNPFNPTTILEFEIEDACEVRLNVYDVNGRMVAELISGQLNAGHYQHTFNATDLPSGVYLVRLTTPNFTATKKMMLLK